MRIHHLNCISTCPLGGRMMDGRSRGVLERGALACHCLLLETASGLVLCDTGLGLQDVANPRARLSSFFLSLLSPDFREEMTAARQIQALGFRPEDVRHIVLTHLDFDHAGGLDDFPNATVHMLAAERDAAALQKTWLDRQRFRPQQWYSRDRWRVYAPADGDRWFGFERVQALEGLSAEVALVPLIGHTLGHCGIAVQGGHRWTLLAGDAYFYHGEMDLDCPRCTPGLRFYQWMMDKDRPARVQNQERLRELKRRYADEVDILSSHDPQEFENHAGRRLLEPARGAIAREKPDFAPRP